MKTLQTILLTLTILAIGAGTPALGGILNQGLIGSPANLDEGITLTDVPLNITEASDEITIEWDPDINGTLMYVLGPPQEPDADYGNYTELLPGNGVTYSPGQVVIAAEALPVGTMSCLIVNEGQGLSSTYFQILRASAFAPELVGPITPNGGTGINNVSPNFSWEPVPGVPYYLIFVADQPFEIEEDDLGETVVQGANIIWQAVTPNTSIQYGIDDPSGTIDNDLTPPLIGDDIPGERPRYNWTVLNCYANDVAFTSDVFGTVAGFEVEVEAPFNDPQLISPEAGAELFDDEILFQWSLVPEASSYFFYLAQYQTYANGTEILFPVWQIQTTENAAVAPASSFLQDNRYIWKVIASNEQGYGAMSDTLAFHYSVDTGYLSLTTETPGGEAIDLVDIDFEVISGPGILPIVTDDLGEYNRSIPAGEYILHASKDGYLDAETDPITIPVDGTVSVTIEMSEQEEGISGVVVDQDGEGVFGATVTLDPTQGPNLYAETNLSGEFFKTLDPDLYTITASANGYQSSDPLTVNVAPNQVVYLTEDLSVQEFTYTLSGIVTNPQGQPIHLSEVTVSGGGETFSTYTNQSGQFDFIVGDGYWIIQASKEGFYLSSGPIDVVVSGEDVDQSIVLSPQEGVISGFTYLNGSLFADDDLQVRATPSAGEPIYVEVGGSGGFSIGLPAGNYDVKGVLDGFTGETVSVTVGPGATVSGVQLNMVPNPSSISGTITTPSGDPVPQATVTTGDLTTTTSAAGSYTLQVSAGTHVISAQKSGYSTVSSSPRQVNYGQDLINVNLQMSPNVAEVSGTVKNNGVGVLGATVTATPQNGDPITVTSGTGGTYSIGLVPGTYTLTAQKSGFIVTTPASGQFDLNLQPGAQVTGRNFAIVANSGLVSGTITGPSGPLYGASVLVRRVGQNTGGQTITSGVNGNYSVTVEQGYSYTVTANKTGYAQATGTTPGAVEPDGEQTVNLQMSQLGASIAGRVDNVNGTPIVGATVIATDGPDSYSATTNGSGNYVISLPPGTYEMDASAAGYLDAFQDVTADPGQNLTGQNFELDFNFALIAGFVLDTNDDEVAQANITLDKQGGASVTTVADAGGFYQFDQVTSGIYTIEVQKSGYVTTTEDIGLVVDGQEVEDADIVMEIAASAFTGTVTADGNPIAEATVRATSSDNEVYTTITGGSGTYNLQGIGAGTYTIEALRSGYTGSPIPGQNVDPGQTATVNATLVENDGEITGTVERPNGQSLSAVAVSAEATGTGHFYQGLTAADGSFSLTGIYPNTTYDITFSKSGFGQVVEEDVADGANLDITLEPNELQITGSTLNQVGSPLSSIPVRATNLDDGTITDVVSNAQGNFTLTEIAKNTEYAIVTLSGGTNIVDADTNLTTGNANISGLELGLIQQTASISGSTGVSGANISATRTGGNTKTTFADADGFYLLANLREGNWTVSASKQGYSFPNSPIAVNNLGVGEARTGIDFTAESNDITIAGQVISTQGVILDSVEVRLVAGANTRIDTTDAQGNFEYVDVPGYTNYNLFATFNETGFESDVLNLETENNDLTNLEIEVIITRGLIEGTLTDADDGSNLSNVSIELNGADIQTFGGGTYDFDGLAAGDYTLVFSRPGYFEETRTTTLDTGLDSVVVNVEMSEIQNGFYVSVRDTLTGENRDIYGALGRLWTMDQDPAVDPPLDSLRSNQSGGIVFEGLDPDGNYRIRVTKKGYQLREMVNRNPQNNPTLTAVLGGLENHVIGYLRGRQGQRYNNGYVFLRAQNGNNRIVRTDQFGSYAVETFNGPMTIIASNDQDSLTSYIYSFTVPTGATRFRDFQIRTAGQIFGEVRTDDGEVPASRALIETANFTTGTFAFRRAREDDGGFRVRGLRPGDFQVSMSIDGYDNPDAQSLTLTAGDSVEVNFVVENPITSIVGVVSRSDNDEGLNGATVTLSGPEDRTATSGGDGDYAFTDITPGDYTISASKPGYAGDSGTISVGTGEVAALNLSLTPQSNAASGFVYDIGGEDPMEGVEVRLRDADDNSLLDTKFTGTDGSYEFTLTAAGRYLIRPQGNYSPSEREFEHEIGNNHTDLNFERVEVQGTGVVQGQVTWRGTPLQGVEVQLDELAGPLFYEVITGPNGNFLFEANSPVRYRLRAISDEYGTLQTGGFQLDTDATLTRNLAFQSGQFGIRVADSENRRTPNIPVFITATDGSVDLTLVTNASGEAITDPNLPDGDYTIEISSPDTLLAPSPGTYTISGGDSVGVRLPLGFDLDYAETVNIGDPITVTVQVHDEYSVTSAQLFYRVIGENIYRSVPMTGGPGANSIGGGPQGTLPGELKTLKSKATGKRDKRVASSQPQTRIKASQARGSGNRVTGMASPGGTDGLIAFTATIPAQASVGELYFYPLIELNTGVVMGREEAARMIQVSNIGIVETVEIRPAFSELQPNVPRKMTMRAFDALGNNVTQDLLDDPEATINWNVGRGSFIDVAGQTDAERIYFYQTTDTSTVSDSVTVDVTQPLLQSSVERGVVRRFSNKVRVLGELALNANRTDVAAGDSITFSVVATDTGGTVMGVAPMWFVEAGGTLDDGSEDEGPVGASLVESVDLGGLRPIEYTQDARFYASAGRFGTVQVGAIDPISGNEARFNSVEGSEGGLSVYLPIASGSGVSQTVDNGEDVSVTINFEAGAMAGRDGRLTLRRPALVTFQRFNSGKEALNTNGYRFLLAGNLDETELTYDITLPIPGAARGRNPQVARWSVEALAWELLGGAPNDEETEVTLTLDPETQGGINGLFTVLADAKPLAVENLVFRPNPFSPTGGYPLSVEFTLHSLYPDVWVTIDIYNMNGAHVRTLKDQEVMPKGRYARVDGDNEPIIWDGLTDDGRMARNGRYLVHITIKDAEGEEEELEPVVLIK